MVAELVMSTGSAKATCSRNAETDADSDKDLFTDRVQIDEKTKAEGGGPREDNIRKKRVDMNMGLHQW